MGDVQLTLDFDAEEWRPVVGRPAYEVSSLGRVRRCTPAYRRRVNTLVLVSPAGKILRPVNRGYGYVYVTLCDSASSAKTAFPIHCLVCEAFHGPRPTPAHKVAHNDGSRANNAATNLRWATQAENCADKVAHGTVLFGENCPASKMTDIEIRMIRRWGAEGIAVREIARRVPLARPTIRAILTRESWKHLP